MSTSVLAAVSSRASSAPPAHKVTTRCRRTYKGHFSKVIAIQWLDDAQTFLSAGLDGKVIFWNAFSGKKMKVIFLKSRWITACCATANGSLVCTGGMKNECTIYQAVPHTSISSGNVSDFNDYRPVADLYEQGGFIYSCKFLTDANFLSSSSDGSVVYWDVSTRRPVYRYNHHKSDVTGIAVLPGSISLFLTTSYDSTCRIFDTRSRSCVQVYTTSAQKQVDFNCAAFLSTGSQFITGSSDSAVRLYDVRTGGILHRYRRAEGENQEVGAVCASLSGRYIYGAFEDATVKVWDSLSESSVGALAGHENRVDCMEMAPNGHAIVTGSWDKELRLWF